MNSDGSNFQILHSFEKDTGEEPHGIPIMGSDGVTLYGITQFGGVYDPFLENQYGTVFSMEVP